MTNFEHPWGHLKLSRHPLQDENLLAYNAADAYLLNYAASLNLKPETLVLVFNDDFGALSLALIQGGYRVIHCSDSSLSQRSVLINAEENGLSSDDRLTFLDSLTRPQESPGAVIIKVPRNLSFLEHQLRVLRPLMDSSIPLVAGGMSKEIHNSTLELFTKILGPVTTSLAEKKARLIFGSFDDTLDAEPFDLVQRWEVPGIGLKVAAQPNVFSRERLDGGTRFLLQHFPRAGKSKVIIDLGCGCGILGAVAAKMGSEVLAFCIDESFMAVWSARETFRQNNLEAQGVFLAGDGLEDFDKNYGDRILCNPPFHDTRAQSTQVAQRMFEDSFRVLKEGGELWVVANAHLGYHKDLEGLFGKVHLIAQSEKYKIWKAVKSPAFSS